MKTTPTNIQTLEPNQIFVFGSNKEGQHLGGAAKLAHDKFGAIMGQGHGLQGQSYAIDTMSGIDVIKSEVEHFIKFASNSNLEFLVTEIGCGIAGFNTDQIAPFFTDAMRFENIVLPQSFMVVKGFKVTNSDFSCNPEGNYFKYELDKTFVHNGRVQLCNGGFHFCRRVNDCFSYYPFDSKNRVFEVEASGKMDFGDDKISAEKIRFIREIPWEEVLRIANIGLNNTGHSNTGDRNTGNYNTGDSNTGNSNTGNSNTGNYNTGDSNTGNSNTGNSNTGNSNTGDRNTGYCNTGNRNTGLFCTEDAPFPIFDMPSDWTEEKFKTSIVYDLLCQVETKLWVPEYMMSDDEKASAKGWKAAEGYVKDIPFKQAFQDKWNDWSIEYRQHFLDLPNFDAKKFEHITGVKL